MITPEDLRKAISDCQGVHNPTAQTCIKMAAYYVLLDHLGDDKIYSSPGEYSSNTDFGKAIKGKEITYVLSVMDDLMTRLQAVKPDLYDAVMKKLGSTN